MNGANWVSGGGRGGSGAAGYARETDSIQKLLRQLKPVRALYSREARAPFDHHASSNNNNNDNIFTSSPTGYGGGGRGGSYNLVCCIVVLVRFIATACPGYLCVYVRKIVPCDLQRLNVSNGAKCLRLIRITRYDESCRKCGFQ